MLLVPFAGDPLGTWLLALAPMLNRRLHRHRFLQQQGKGLLLLRPDLGGEAEFEAGKVAMCHRTEQWEMRPQ